MLSFSLSWALSFPPLVSTSRFYFVCTHSFSSPAVAARFGIGKDFWINILLTICGYIPGQLLFSILLRILMLHPQATATTFISRSVLSNPELLLVFNPLPAEHQKQQVPCPHSQVGPEMGADRYLRDQAQRTALPVGRPLQRPSPSFHPRRSTPRRGSGSRLFQHRSPFPRYPLSQTAQRQRRSLETRR